MRLLKTFLITAGILALFALLTAVELHFIKMPALDITTRILLAGLLSINIIALLTLIFFVGKNLFRLYTERKQKILGYKFRTKLMTIFVVLTLIPSMLLFFVSSGLVTNYIDRIFSPQIKEPVMQSIELAKSFYDFERQRALNAAKLYAEGMQVSGAGISIKKLVSVSPEAGEMVQEALKGREGSEIISLDIGDIVRAAVPVSGGVVVAEFTLPKDLALQSGRLRDMYEDLIKQQGFRSPLKINYILILGFITLMIVFTSLWVSLKISKGITIPIQELASATEQIALGNLDLKVNPASEDEIGLLTESFNLMVSQLRDNKESLQSAYKELDRRRLYLETILENINSGVIFLDPSGRIVTANKLTGILLDVDAATLAGKNYLEFISMLNSEELSNIAAELKGRFVNEVKKIAKVNINGKIMHFRIYLTGLRDSSASGSLGMLVVFDDITDLIKAEKALAWQEVAKRLAHEIKNPLTPIKLSAERLIRKWSKQSEDFGEVLEKSVATITSEVESLRGLVDIFSRYGRMPEMKKEAADIAQLIRSVIFMYKGFKDIRIDVSIQKDLPDIYLDIEQFKRVLINIMDNAIKAMSGSGSININTTLDENTIIIDIADNGPGISDDIKDKLFMPYFSGTDGGTGLGLAIASKIVNDHDGFITVKDNRPRGAVFTIGMPAVQTRRTDA
ncbi:MAG: ATP-binding protein [Dissulfurispiraceae bacterium]|jgi:two-component system nitrogen regulation sensor histidine kinase NtrY|nr:ATP-binding protein [Dissulfurispiraceae bacterium]